jgi:hypothetical protein
MDLGCGVFFVSFEGVGFAAVREREFVDEAEPAKGDESDPDALRHEVYAL